MENSVPSSIDVPFAAADYAKDDAHFAFRRQPFWFLSFVMTPFKDIDSRTVEDRAPRRAKQARGR